MKYVIKSKKYNNYYNKKVAKNFWHFVEDIREAKYLTKREADEIMKKFNKIDNYEIVPLRSI